MQFHHPNAPLFEEIPLPAPLPEVFAAFLDQPDPVFVDSSLVHPHLGRYSYIAAEPILVLRCKDGRIRISERGQPGSKAGEPELLTPKSQEHRPHAGADPFAELQRILRRHRSRTISGLPPFQGGAIGYFAYDLGRHLEVLPRTAIDDMGTPDICVGLYSWVLSHDHLSNRTWLLVNPVDGDRDAAVARLAWLHRRIAAVKPDPDARPTARARRPNRIRSNFTPDAYLRAIAAAKEYIASGDIYEVCLSQRLTVDLDTHPWEFYRRLRAVSPVTYGAYLGFDDVKVASVSPELFLRLDRSHVETRPIKGTRPRGRTPDLDATLAEQLQSSEKDRAENVMIVDLLRNDLGRACRIGSVRAPVLFGLESYSTVHHLVSVVQGELRPELDAVDLLRACFPGGSVTGCPKIRAMEIVDELEPTQRGIYCGCIGFIGFDGQMDTSIAIRTAVIKDGQVHYQVGGAIVADSDPDGEYRETLDKARALLLSLGVTDLDE